MTLNLQEDTYVVYAEPNNTLHPLTCHKLYATFQHPLIDNYQAFQLTKLNISVLSSYSDRNIEYNKQLIVPDKGQYSIKMHEKIQRKITNVLLSCMDRTSSRPICWQEKLAAGCHFCKVRPVCNEA